MQLSLKDAQTGDALRPSRWSAFVRNNGSTLLIYGLIVLVGVGTAIYSDSFRNPANLISLLRQSIVLGFLSIGQSLVVLTGGMDMSVAMVARVVALVAATVFNLTGNSALILPVILLGIGVGALVGAINGLMITRTHANPFIITLGMAGILRGICLAISSTPIRGIPAGYLRIYDARIGRVPINVIVMALVWVLAWLVMTRTRWGRAVFAVGGSERVAELSAIRVNRTLVWVYTACSACAALAGLFFLARTGVGDPNTADGLDFQSVVAVALGGSSLYGGKGSMVGTLGGVLLLAMLSNVFNLVQINIFYQQLLLGLVVLIAVAAYKSPRSA